MPGVRSEAQTARSRIPAAAFEEEKSLRSKVSEDSSFWLTRASRCGCPSAPAQASRGEALRADDAIARNGARLLRDHARRKELLESLAAPIVLLQPKPGSDIAWNVAHCSPYLGVMLPYSPLHHLLMRECPFPLIATSGNRSDEPIAIANDEATARLKDIAGHFLMHDRPIVRACDDSVVRLTRGRAGILRRARGYAPLGIRVSAKLCSRCSQWAAI